jgi:hypothetical protein
MPTLNPAEPSCKNDYRLWLIAALCLLPIGCGSPSAANIELRKQQQKLQSQNDQLTQQHQLDLETLAACQRSHPTTTA